MPEDSKSIIENEKIFFCGRRVRMVVGILCRKSSGELFNAMLVDRGL